jgi:Uma2 family endonuclease
MTEEEFMRLPDDGRKYELVDGEAKEVATSVKHELIGMTVAILLRQYARGIGYVAGSSAGYRMTDRNIRCPDVALILKSNLPNGEMGEGFGDRALDLCIEIISTREDRADMQRKLVEYFDSGAQKVWHMFPESQTIRVYTSPFESRTYEASDEIDAGELLPGFRCRVSELFELE